MCATKPTIVIIPGSFSPKSFYFTTVDKLREYGYEALVNDLPSASRLPPEEAATMYEDADYFRAVAEKLADEGKDVVFVTHSYGGVVGTEAAKGIVKTDRQAAGKPGGIIRLVYVTSVVPSPGNSLRSLMGDLVPSFIEVEGGFMYHADPESSAKLTFSELPLEKSIEEVKKMSRHSAVSFVGELTYPAYKHVPVSWVFCEKDVILPPDFQNKGIENIEKESGRKVNVIRMPDSDHCPNVCQPIELATAIRDAIVAA
ncbi:uncharacterized protein A1O9_08008 [Exophiala aquamarina CBS 119918]|uniref:AB hydrolase-1 domain-containing protein n=1 Tax=Exophiala aquamarina CBS 119918 TaxID=1182545 RepID=A0A072P9J3_9EURO|nr:uncharacterized protein A1O9_08008 [Exophiala aquamarina CBS 119918]KEF56427.1 hypothetical protein A1O9_08008 [Exophiala aquamarina CBS 119918]